MSNKKSNFHYRIKDLGSAIKERSGPEGKVYILHFKRKTKYHKIGIKTVKFEFNSLTDFGKLTMSLQHDGRMFAPEIKDSTFKLKRLYQITNLKLAFESLPPSVVRTQL